MCVPVLLSVMLCGIASVRIDALRSAVPALQLVFCAVRAHTRYAVDGRSPIKSGLVCHDRPDGIVLDVDVVMAYCTVWLPGCVTVMGFMLMLLCVRPFSASVGVVTVAPVPLTTL